MAKVYSLTCSDIGVDCGFETRADSIEAVVEQCADHARHQHGMTSFGPDLFAKMRSCVRVLDQEPTT
jgi:predicted small metal-binding protein